MYDLDQSSRVQMSSIFHFQYTLPLSPNILIIWSGFSAFGILFETFILSIFLAKGNKEFESLHNEFNNHERILTSRSGETGNYSDYGTGSNRNTRSSGFNLEQSNSETEAEDKLFPPFNKYIFGGPMFGGLGNQV